MPFSPYDFDNHVVAEIYDRTLKKWIMLDPTSDGFFIDEAKTPLSLLEMRDRFANGEFVTYAQSTASLKDIHRLRSKRWDANMYICKNLFYFRVEKYSSFGERGEYLHFIPRHYSIKETQQANLKYRLDNLPPEHEELRKKLEERLLQAAQYSEPPRINIQVMEKKPF